MRVGSEPQARPNISVTFFSNFAARTKREADTTLTQLADTIRKTNKQTKQALPWLKLARFGDTPTPIIEKDGKKTGGSLRHNDNVLAITGIEADYDGEQIPVADAIARLKDVGVRSIVYTSPSHAPDRPRWRVLCPLAREHSPEQRDMLMGRLNGLFRGAFSVESWTLSQSFYYGSVSRNPDHQVELIDGQPIDVRDDLPSIGKRPDAPPKERSISPGGTYVPASDARLEGYRSSIVGDVRQAADGQKHLVLRNAALALGGIAEAAGFSDDEAISWLMDALPDSVLDWNAAKATATWGLIAGREEPITLPDRPSLRAPTNGTRPAAEAQRAPGKSHPEPVANGAAKPEPHPGNGQDHGGPKVSALDRDMLAHPDMNVLRLHRRSPPVLPLAVFGPRWAAWIASTATASACPVDYVAAPLLAIASVLIGNARWAEAWPGWVEPPHLWACAVGDSGSGKSPGSDVLLRDVLPPLERRMSVDHPESLRTWAAASETDKAAFERWQGEVKTAQKNGTPPPLPPKPVAAPKPETPRLRQNDVTAEKVAMLLATAAPKGLLIHRDEMLGWVAGMTTYNEAGRAFWVEAFGGRPYRVERQKSPEPIDVPHLVVSAFGGTQPAKVAALLKDADDGLLARVIWFWPDPVPFAKGKAALGIPWATEALDHLRRLEMAPALGPDNPPRPLPVPLDDALHADMEAFGKDMQVQQQEAAGLVQSAYGKARGLALRLSLVLTYLRWVGDGGLGEPPTLIGRDGFAAAAHLVADYVMPMAERVYGDAATSQPDRDAATLSRWIVKTRPNEVHVRHLQREVRLPELGTASAIHMAAEVLVEAGWLMPPKPGAFQQRARAAYKINPRIYELAT